MARSNVVRALLPGAIWQATGLLFVLAALWSCTKSTSIEEGGVKLRFINASPDAGGIQFTLNEQNAHTPQLGYRDTTPYIAYPGGTYQLALRNGNTPVINIITDLVPRTAYSFFVVDSAAKMKLSIVRDLLTPADVPLRARVRFFNLSPDAGVLSLRAKAGVDTVVISGGRSFNDQDQSAIATRYVDVPSSFYDLLLYSDNRLLATMPAQLLASGRVYTIFARGFASGTAEKALSVGVIQHY